MKRPNHIILDFEFDSINNTNWSLKFVEDNYQYSHIFHQVRLIKKLCFKYKVTNSSKGRVDNTIYTYKFFSEFNKETTNYSGYIVLRPKPIKPQQVVTLAYLPSALIENKRTLKRFLSKKLAPEKVFLKAGLFTKPSFEEAVNNLKSQSSLFNIRVDCNFYNKDSWAAMEEQFNKKISLRQSKIDSYIRYYTLLYRKLYVIKAAVFNKKKSNFKLSNYNVLRKMAVLHLIKKERLYTKLKYSRSPAYDIVSGGAAALLAGFIGFLISEKYGFELVDSGDFYYLFMYGVFFCFSFRPLSGNW